MISHADTARQRITRIWSAIRDETPAQWISPLRRHILEALPDDPADAWMRPGETIRALDAWRARFGCAKHADLSHAEISRLADEIAEDARALRIGDPLGVAIGPGAIVPIPPADLDPWPAWRQVVAFIERHHGTVPPLPRAGDIAAHLAATARRARCPRWWRRQLRRYVARQAEAAAITLGLVHKRAGQIYVSDRAMRRRAEQLRANEEALKARTIENGDGERVSLWDCMQRSVSNRAIRRGELMTRIRGAEEIATESGLVGTFWTLTAPSRFHPRDHRTGRRNPEYDGSTPREAQQWLRDTWATARTRLKDRGIRMMGLRVAEPHHDGCPHWHALLWCQPEHVQALRSEITSAWFAELPDDPARRRARKRWGTKCVEIDERGAAGYVAKYVAKNIDAPLPDGGVLADHADAAPADMAQQRDMLDGAEVTPAARVEAWAATWGIRQFQALGMPPVSVWRELRRIHRTNIAGRGDPEVTRAWWAAHRHGKQRADWAEYCRAQGGVMLKRTEYRARLAYVEQPARAGYEPGKIVRRPIGVTSDAMRGRLARSMRCEWGPEGFGAAKRAAWTRLNNCGPDTPRARRPMPYADPRPKVYGRAQWEPRKPPDSIACRDPRRVSDLLADLQARCRPPDQATLPDMDPLAHAEQAPIYAPDPPIADLLAALKARARPAL